MEKNSNADRARQFMPFAALRGFEELIRQQEVTPEARRELSEEEAARLSARLSGVERGMLVRVRHYRDGAYRDTVGMVSDIDFALRTLTVVRQVIRFADLYDIRQEETEN